MYLPPDNFGKLAEPKKKQPSLADDRMIGGVVLIIIVLAVLLMVSALDRSTFIPFYATQAVEATRMAR